MRAAEADREQRASRFRDALDRERLAAGGVPSRASRQAAGAKERDTMALERLLGPCEAGGGQAAKNPGAADKPQGAGGNKLAGDETTGAGRSGEAAGEAQGLTAGGAAGQSGGGCVPVKPYAKVGARLPFRGEETIAELAADVAVAAQAIGASSWSRPEGPTQQTSSRSRPRDWPQAVPGGEPVHQLLIGRGPHGAAARMIISTGPLAGTQIQLLSAPCGLEATIVTQSALARQTLGSAMEAVAQRLRDKGHPLEVRFGPSPARSSPGRIGQRARSQR